MSGRKTRKALYKCIYHCCSLRACDTCSSAGRETMKNKQIMNTGGLCCDVFMMSKRYWQLRQTNKQISEQKDIDRIQGHPSKNTHIIVLLQVTCILSFISHPPGFSSEASICTTFKTNQLKLNITASASVRRWNHYNLNHSGGKTAPSNQPVMLNLSI